jgi:hypothetical protein
MFQLTSAVIHLKLNILMLSVWFESFCCNCNKFVPLQVQVNGQPHVTVALLPDETEASIFDYGAE